MAVRSSACMCFEVVVQLLQFLTVSVMNCGQYNTNSLVKNKKAHVPIMMLPL